MSVESIRASLRRQKKLILQEAKTYTEKYFELLDKLPVDKKKHVWYSDREPKIEDLRKLGENDNA